MRAGKLRIETSFIAILNPDYCHCMQFVLAHLRKKKITFFFLSAMNAFKVVCFHPGSQNVPLNIIQRYKVHSHNIYPKEALLHSQSSIDSAIAFLQPIVNKHIHLTVLMIVCHEVG